MMSSDNAVEPMPEKAASSDQRRCQQDYPRHLLASKAARWTAGNKGDVEGCLEIQSLVLFNIAVNRAQERGCSLVST